MYYHQHKPKDENGLGLGTGCRLAAELHCNSQYTTKYMVIIAAYVLTYVYLSQDRPTFRTTFRTRLTLFRTRWTLFRTKWTLFRTR